MIRGGTCSRRLAAGLATVAVALAVSNSGARGLSAPRLESPGNAASTPSPFPRFFWERLPGTLDYQNPVAYDIEIARDAEFRDVVDRDHVPLARYIADQPLAPGGYFWRVRAVPPDGAPRPWSGTRALTISPCDAEVRAELKGSGEALPALRNALARAARLGKDGRSVRIVVPPGNYSLTPDTPAGKECLLLHGVSNLTIDFGGSRFGIKRWGAAFTRARSCHDIALLNATVDWDGELPFTQAVVAGADAANGTVTVRIEPGFPEFDAPHFARSSGFGILLHSSIPGRMKAGTPLHFGFKEKETVNKGGRLWELRPARKTDVQYFDPGDRFVKFARDDGGTSLCDSRDCERLTYFGITSTTTGGGGHYTAFYDNEMAVLHCRELIKEGRWFGGNADGVHAKAHPTGPWIEDLEIDGIGDDGIALYTRPAKIHEAHVDGNPRVFLFHDDSFNLDPGDEVVFFNPRRGIYYAEAVVRAAAREGKCHRVEFDRDLPLPEKTGPDPLLDDQVWNRSKSCGDFMIRGCRLANIRRFGMVFRARRGVVENNRIEAATTAGILSLNEPLWPNGPMSSEILIQNNALKNNGICQSAMGSIVLFTRKHGNDPGEGRGPRNILIRGNTITDWQKCALLVSGAEHIVAANNTITSSGAVPFVHGGNTAIRVHHSRDITLQGNVLRDPRPGFEAFSITDTEGFSGDGTTGASAAR